MVRNQKGCGLYAPLIMLAMGIVGSAISLNMYTYPDYSYILSISSQYGMLIILTVFSALCLLAGSLGLCAVCQLNTGMLTAFWILTSICIFGFSTGAGLGLGTPLLFNSYGCTGQVYPSVPTISNQVNYANQVFCRVGCSCYISVNGGFNTSGIQGLNNITNIALPISVIQCPTWGVGIYDRMLGTFERDFKCAGWCSTNDRYLFSDINQGNPKQACFKALSDWFIDYSRPIYITCFVFAGMCLVLVIWICIFMRYFIQEHPEYENVMQIRASAVSVIN